MDESKFSAHQLAKLREHWKGKYQQHGELVEKLFAVGLSMEERADLELVRVELNAYEMEKMRPSLEALERLAESFAQVAKVTREATEAMKALKPERKNRARQRPRNVRRGMK